MTRAYDTFNVTERADYIKGSVASRGRLLEAWLALTVG